MSLLKTHFFPKYPAEDLQALCAVKSALSLGWDFFPFLTSKRNGYNPITSRSISQPLRLGPLKPYWN